MNSPSTPLPDQGGFNKRLDDAFMHLIDQIATRRVTDDDIANTKAAIRTLVLEEIIGEDEAQGVVFNKNSKKNLRPRYKNMLRAEQRKKLERSKG